MTTDPNTRVYLKVGEEWAELPQTRDGPHVVYHIAPALAQAAGGTYIFRTEASQVNFTPPPLPDGATINDATLELTRSPFSGGVAYRWADEEE